MEFKITHETTLYDLQEFCKDMTCINCNLYNGHYCTFRVDSPDDWELPKFKTYKEDFLEKFPNTFMWAGTPTFCREVIYSGRISCDSDSSSCRECWNEIMEDDINAE